MEMERGAKEMKVVRLEERNQVKAMLEKAIERDFDTIMLFGIKDGEYKVMGTGSMDRIRVIGFLEAAKVEMWAGVPDEHIAD